MLIARILVMAILLITGSTTSADAQANTHRQRNLTLFNTGIEPFPSTVMRANADAFLRSDLSRDDDASGLDEACCVSTISIQAPQALDCLSIVDDAPTLAACVAVASGGVGYVDWILIDGNGQPGVFLGIAVENPRAVLVSKAVLASSPAAFQQLATVHALAAAFLNGMVLAPVSTGSVFFEPSTSSIRMFGAACSASRLPPSFPNPVFDCPCIDSGGGTNATASTDGDLCNSSTCTVCNQGQCNGPPPDSDGDGKNDCEDNCPSDPNANQENSDTDSVGDVCDNCQLVDNDSQLDGDNDNAGDVCDNCSTTFNSSQADADSDMIGDVCDAIELVALGDSYSSGEGGRPYELGTATDNNGCHRSQKAYSALIMDPPALERIAQLAIDDPTNFSYEFLACSGATTINVRKISDGGVPSGPEGSPPNPPYDAPDNVTQLDRMDGGGFVVSGDTDLVTVTIGGNDVGFAPILQHCFTNFFGNCKDDPLTSGAPPLSQSLPDKIDDVRLEIRSLLSRIKNAAPIATIIMAGYPRLVSGNECLELGAGPVKVTQTEQLFLKGIADQVNTMLAEEAVTAGVHFVPVADRFTGHEVCTNSPPAWLYGLDVIGVSDRFKSRSFHPKERGHIEYAAAIDDYIAAWRASGAPLNDNGLPKNPVAPLPLAAPLVASAQAASATPTVGRLHVRAQTPPPACLDNLTFHQFQLVYVSGTGFAPLESVELDFRQTNGSPDIPILTLTADANGALVDQFGIVPLVSTFDEPGAFAAEAPVGAGGAGTVLVSDLLRIVGGATTDQDSDGVLDLCDLCIDDADASNVDRDGDRIGDACDTCADDPENDFDGDGLCADVDPDPYNPPGTPPTCGLGPEIAGALGLLYVARRSRRRRR